MSQFTQQRDIPSVSEYIMARDGYVITRERTVYWSRYILWSPDGVLLQKNSALSEIVKFRDNQIDKEKK